MDSGRWRRPHAALFLAGLVALLAAPKLLRFWAGDPIFSLGFLVAPWAIWWILRLEPKEAARIEFRLTAFALALALAVGAWHLRSTWMSLWALVAAMAAVAAEKGRLKSAALPLVLLAIMAPPPAFDTFLNGAQLAVAGASAFILRLIGTPVVWDGFILSTSEYSFVVEPLCSGMSGMLATTALVGIAGTHLGAGRKRMLLAIGLGLLMTWTLNLLRVVVLVALTQHRGPDLIEGAFHDGVSLVMSIAVTLLLLPLLLMRRTDPGAPEEVAA